MALFDLQCNDCQEEFHKIVSYSKLPEVACPKCGSNNHRRVYKTTVKGPVSTGGSSSTYRSPQRGFT